MWDLKVAFFNVSHKGISEKLKEIAAKNSIDRKLTQDPPAHNLGSTVNCSGFIPRPKYKGLIIRIIRKLFSLIVKDPIKNYMLTKSMILILYRKRYLSRYISNRRLHCYLWKDQNADKYFEDYINFMNSLYESVSVEIEIKE